MTLHRSLGLTTVLTELITERACVLDLGPMSAGTLQAFLNKNCKVYFEDLNAFIKDQSAPRVESATVNSPPISPSAGFLEYSLDFENDELAYALDEYLLGCPESVKFDLILTWDLFNYLDLPTIQYLMDRLSKHCKNGTVLHTIRYVGQKMPEFPRRFNLQESFDLRITEASDGLVKAMGHSTFRLLQKLGGFHLQNTLMNQEGMLADVSEHLLIYDQDQSANKIIKANPTELVPHFGKQNQETAIELPALSQLLAELGTEKRSDIDQLHVFDNGSKVGRSLETLTTIASELYVEDLCASNYWQRKIDNDTPFAVSEYMLRFPSELKFDLVLLWDLFNHCSDAQVEAITQSLLEHMGDSARLHFIAYSGFRPAERPPLFEIESDLSVKIIGAHDGGRVENRRSSAALLKLLPQFSIERTVFGKLNEQQFYQEFLLAPKL